MKFFWELPWGSSSSRSSLLLPWNPYPNPQSLGVDFLRMQFKDAQAV